MLVDFLDTNSLHTELFTAIYLFLSGGMFAELVPISIIHRNYRLRHMCILWAYRSEDNAGILLEALGDDRGSGIVAYKKRAMLDERHHFFKRVLFLKKNTWNFVLGLK